MSAQFLYPLFFRRAGRVLRPGKPRRYSRPLLIGNRTRRLIHRVRTHPSAFEQPGSRNSDTGTGTAWFTALTAAWVRTPDPRREAFDETLAILDATPGDPSRLPAGLGRIAEAKTRFSPEDSVGPKWLEKASFYEPKRLAATLEDVALDATLGRPLRSAALDALGSIDGKKRTSAVRDKLGLMSDEDSKALSAKPSKGNATKQP